MYALYTAWGIMKCRKPEFLDRVPAEESYTPPVRPAFPDKLVDYLTGREIPFTNRDNIRQRVLRFLVEEKGYLKEDISCDREITFDLDGQQVRSLVDISLCLDNKTLMIWKCASGSLVTRERQIMAAARLLEDYIVPFASVTNGIDLELLDATSGEVIGTELGSVFSRSELLNIETALILKPVNKKKQANEKLILFTYDEISCQASCPKEKGIVQKP